MKFNFNFAAARARIRGSPHECMLRHTHGHDRSTVAHGAHRCTRALSARRSAAAQSAGGPGPWHVHAVSSV